MCSRRRGWRAATLILFDIDGTLVLTGGAGARAMTLAFEDLSDTDAVVRALRVET